MTTGTILIIDDEADFRQLRRRCWNWKTLWSCRRRMRGAGWRLCNSSDSTFLFTLPTAAEVAVPA